MAQTNQVYVQLGYSESLESKKEILSSEISLLNLMRIIKRYNALRLEEIKTKSKIRKAIKGLGIKTRETQASFPFLKVPQKRGKLNTNEKEKRIIEIKEKSEDNLEYQLREIQEKLRAINKI